MSEKTESSNPIGMPTENRVNEKALITSSIGVLMRDCSNRLMEIK